MKGVMVLWWVTLGSGNMESMSSSTIKLQEFSWQRPWSEIWIYLYLMCILFVFPTHIPISIFALVRVFLYLFCMTSSIHISLCFFVFHKSVLKPMQMEFGALRGMQNKYVSRIQTTYKRNTNYVILIFWPMPGKCSCNHKESSRKYDDLWSMWRLFIYCFWIQRCLCTKGTLKGTTDLVTTNIVKSSKFRGQWWSIIFFHIHKE